MNIDITTINNFFFVGIAGTGMSAIAQYLKGIGKSVSGSDRQFGKDNKIPLQKAFEHIGIDCFYQDASGVTKDTEVLVISTAIEQTNIEYRKALELNIPIVKRSDILAAISKSKKTIAVGGTSGKSTTTAMIFHILNDNKLSPSLITGAGLSELQKDGLPGNAYVGESDILVIESDESDGSIVSYHPETALLLNIDRDHKEYDELISLFSTFKANTQKHFIVNRDYDLTKNLSQSISSDFGTKEQCGFYGSNFSQKGFSIEFMCNDAKVILPAIGKHNMENALAAIAACSFYELSTEQCSSSLQSFKGIYRRTQLVGKKDNVIVIDDFAHNPAEVKAAIQACQNICNCVHAWFQPHGYGPLRFMHEELTETIEDVLRPTDFYYMSDVYYAGGSVDKDINSDVVINPLRSKNLNTFLIPDKNELPDQIKRNITQDDTVVLLMGARDPGLENFANYVFNTL